MLIREDDLGVLAIGQPSHAWLSGQLARAWGNPRFGAVEPLEEVCLAAEQHDVGWDARDLAPLLDHDSGRPCSFMQMPLEIHLGLFTDGPRRMLSQSRYAALLVSLHGWRLYDRRDLDGSAPEAAAAIRRFLDGQRTFQAQRLRELRADPATEPWSRDEVVERNSMLIWTWDYLSLALCLGWDTATARAVPTAEGHVDLELRRASAAGTWQLDPWPFRCTRLEVRCEGRRLTERFEDEPELRAALEHARWETLELRLEPV